MMVSKAISLHMAKTGASLIDIRGMKLVEDIFIIDAKKGFNLVEKFYVCGLRYSFNVWHKIEGII